MENYGEDSGERCANRSWLSGSRTKLSLAKDRQALKVPIHK